MITVKACSAVTNVFFLNVDGRIVVAKKNEN